MNINKNGKTGLTETDAEERTPSLLDCLRMRAHAHTIAYTRARVYTSGTVRRALRLCLNDLRRPLSVYGSCVCVDRCVCVVWPARNRRYVCMRYMH